MELTACDKSTWSSHIEPAACGTSDSSVLVVGRRRLGCNWRFGGSVSVILYGCLALGVIGCANSWTKDQLVVLRDGKLGSNMELGVDSSTGDHNWVRLDDTRDALVLNYPLTHQFGTATFLLGLDDPARRPYDNLTTFETLQIELSGSWKDAEVGVSFSGVGSAPGEVVDSQQCLLGAQAPGEEFVTASIRLDRLDPTCEVRSKLWAPAKITLTNSVIWVRSITLFKQDVETEWPCIVP